MPREANERIRILKQRPREEWLRMINEIPDLVLRRVVACHVWWDYLAENLGFKDDEFAKFRREYKPDDLNTDKSAFANELVRMGYTQEEAIDRVTPPSTSTIYKTQHVGGAYKRRDGITQLLHRVVSG